MGINQEQLDFLKSEFGITLDDLNAMDDDALEDLYEKCADIEIEEVEKAPDGPETDRLRLAASIVDLLSM